MALRLDFVVNDKATPEIKKLQTQLKQLQPTIKGAETSFLGLNSSLVKLGATYLSVQGISNLTGSFISIADEATQMTTKLNLATDSMAELNTAQSELFSIAQETRTSLSSNADLFERLSRSTRDYNLEQKELLDITETINKAIVISGASSASSQAAIVQFGQALSADFQSVGQELASVREQAPRLYQALLEGTNTTSKEFKKLAEEGKLSTEIIIKALKSQGIAVSDEFGKVQRTVEQSSTQAGNSILLLVDNFDDLLSISENVTSAIDGFRGAIDSLNKIVESSKPVTEIFELDVLESQAKELQTQIDSILDDKKLTKYKSATYGGIFDLGFWQDIFQNTKMQDNVLVQLQDRLNVINAQIRKANEQVNQSKNNKNNSSEDGSKKVDNEQVSLFDFEEADRQFEKLDKYFDKWDKIKIFDEDDPIRDFLNNTTESFRNASNEQTFDIEDPVRDFIQAQEEWDRSVQDLGNFIDDWSGVVATSATMIFDSIYDGITNGYKDAIEANQSAIDTLNLRSTGLSAFGQGGASSVANFQAIQAQISAQETLNSQYYDLSESSAQYYETVLRITEGLAIAGGVVGVFGGGVVEAVELLLSAEDLAGDLTGFNEFQESYIEGTKELQSLYDELQTTLIDVSSAVFDNISTFEDFYDSITNSNRFLRETQSQALATIAGYTGGDVSQSGIAEFVEDIINAQKAFVSESTSLASGGNAELINSIDIFDKYGLAIDSLNDSLLESVRTVSDLIQEQNEANDTIKDYITTLREEYGDLTGSRFQTQTAVAEALLGFQSGTTSASDLISSASAFNSTLTEEDVNLRRQLIANLEQVSEAEDTNDLLNDLLNESENSTSLLTDVTQSLSIAEDIDVQTLDAITVQSSLIEMIIESLGGGFEAILDAMSEIISLISSVLSTLGDILEAIEDVLGGTVGALGGGINGVVNGVVSAFGFADGGYTGSGGKYDVAGVVHKGEYVVPSDLVKSNPNTISFLESQRKGTSYSGQYYNGGIVSSSMSSTNEDKLDIVIQLLNSILVSNNKELKIVKKWDIIGVPQGEDLT